MDHWKLVIILFFLYFTLAGTQLHGNVPMQSPQAELGIPSSEYQNSMPTIEGQVPYSLRGQQIPVIPNQQVYPQQIHEPTRLQLQNLQVPQQGHIQQNPMYPNQQIPLEQYPGQIMAPPLNRQELPLRHVEGQQLIYPQFQNNHVPLQEPNFQRVHAPNNQVPFQQSQVPLPPSQNQVLLPQSQNQVLLPQSQNQVPLPPSQNQVHLPPSQNQYAAEPLFNQQGIPEQMPQFYNYGVPYNFPQYGQPVAHQLPTGVSHLRPPSPVQPQIFAPPNAGIPELAPPTIPRKAASVTKPNINNAKRTTIRMTTPSNANTKVKSNAVAKGKIKGDHIKGKPNDVASLKKDNSRKGVANSTKQNQSYSKQQEIKGSPCNCSNWTCICCAHLPITQELSKNKTNCFQFSTNADMLDFKIWTLTPKTNKRPISFKTDNTKEVCSDPIHENLKNGTYVVRSCFKLYDVSRKLSNLHSCFKVELHVEQISSGKKSSNKNNTTKKDFKHQPSKQTSAVQLDCIRVGKTGLYSAKFADLKLKDKFAKSFKNENETLSKSRIEKNPNESQKVKDKVKENTFDNETEGEIEYIYYYE